MRFALRDDDVCWHTDPAVLEALYGELSQRCPVSFGCIPFVGGFDIDAFTPAKWAQLDEQWIPWQTREAFPLGDNPALVTLLRAWCDEGRATVLLHGVHHDLYELTAERPFEAEIAHARAYLEELFRRPVRVASAPNNSLGRSATRALAASGFDILVSFGHLPRERPASIANYTNFARLLLLYARYRRTQRLTRPLRFTDHREQGCYDLGPNSNVDDIFRGIDRAAAAHGNVVVATHYYHLAARPELMRVLQALLDYAERRAHGSIRFVPAEALFAS